MTVDQAPRSYIVRATPDGTQMRRNRFHLQPTKEEASPAPSLAWEAVASDESNPCRQPNTDAGIKTPEMESQPDILQEEQLVRRSLLLTVFLLYRILSNYYKFKQKEPLGDFVVVHTQNLTDRYNEPCLPVTTLFIFLSCLRKGDVTLGCYA